MQDFSLDVYKGHTLSMNPCGDYGLTPVIPRLLAKYKNTLNDKQKNATAQRDKALRRPRKRKGPP